MMLFLQLLVILVLSKFGIQVHLHWGGGGGWGRGLGVLLETITYVMKMMYVSSDGMCTFCSQPHQHIVSIA